MRNLYKFFFIAIGVFLFFILFQPKDASAEIWCGTENRRCCCGSGWRNVTVSCFRSFYNYACTDCDDAQCWDVCDGDTPDACGSQCPCEPSCTECTLAACPAGTSTTATSYGYTQVTCGEDECFQSKNCYCTAACTPPACPSNYSTVDRGVGVATTTSCTNSCNSPNSRTCYYNLCSDCTLVCPASLTLTNTGYPVTTTSCNRGNDCRGTSKTGTCYENASAKPFRVPTTGFAVNINTNDNSLKGYTTNTATGAAINNPVSMSATFRDTDGVAQIEAVSFWLQTAPTTPSTPINIDATVVSGNTNTNNSWGFMLHKEGTNWVPYVASQSTGKWVKAAVLSNQFMITGPSGSQIARVSGYQSPVISGLTDIRFTFSLEFLSGSSVTNGIYNVFTMVNDTFGFTPYDNYAPTYNTNWVAGRIRYPSDWSDTGTDWYIDLVDPISDLSPLTVDVITGATPAENALRVSWNFNDNLGIDSVVGNIYASGMPLPINEYVQVSNGTSYVNYNLTIKPENEATIGNFITNAFKRTTRTGSIDIRLGSVETGSLIFYVTAFDRAGNNINSSTSFDLTEWIISRSGFVYTAEGVELNIRNLQEDAWASKPLLTAAGFIPSTVDVTSEMLGTDQATALSFLRFDTGMKTYEVPNLDYPGDTTVYENLKTSFTQKLELKGQTGAVPANASEYTGTFAEGTSLCNASEGAGCYKYGIYTSPVTIGRNFQCNGQALLFFENTLSIIPGSIASSPGTCIFVSNQNVSILQGANVSTTSTAYETVDAFVVASGSINIPYDNAWDGLLIRGGLYSANGSIEMGRRIILKDRNTFPALAVVNHPKFGILGKKAFGSQIDLVKTEVGFKPY